jgi:hypothetical protein
MEAFRTLSPQEIAKLPRCKRSHYGTCDLKNPDVKTCLRCMADLCFHSLMAENNAGATEALHCILDMLIELKVLEARP